jgi:uncharacterized membrane protein
MGALLACLFGYLQQVSLDKIDIKEAQRALSRTMAFSALRIIVSLAILFLAFRTGIVNGLSCLATFLVVRWIWLIILIRKGKNNTEVR